MSNTDKTAAIEPAPEDTAIERPSGDIASEPQFGSDVVAQALRATGVPYITLNPGASFRGLHDSLVNFLGNRDPQMLLCLHEEHAVAIAQGYAKVTGKPLAVAVHSNVGLMHATMAIFNAWCDRMPVMILGATGPVDAMKRRPWIDWIHTARDQGALVRPYVKWDDQPASPGAAREAVLRAHWLAVAAPQGPVYVNLDAEMQEMRIAAPLPPLDPARYLSTATIAAPAESVRAAVALLRAAQRPLILMGRVSREVAAWDARVALAEALGARVVTDLKVGAAFPTDHPLHVDAPGVFLRPEVGSAIAGADVILSLDYVDLAGTLKAACGGESPAKIIQVSLDHALHNGWSMDHQGHPPVDLFIAATPDAVVPALLEALGTHPARDAAMPVSREALGTHATPDAAMPVSREALGTHATPDAVMPAAREGLGTPATRAQYDRRAFAFAPAPPADGLIDTDQVALVLRSVIGDRPHALAHLPLSWDGASWPFRHPLDFLGSDGGGGIGAGPGIAVGAALALRGSGRLPIGVSGDGDFMMGATSLWTAVHYQIPLLLVVTNNRSFYNDEMHQERVARMRGRPVGNKWIGQRIADPDIDLAAIARAQGAQGFGPVERLGELAAAFTAAIAAVDAGGVAVVDVRVQPGPTPGVPPPTATSTSTKSDRG